jgi:hypothetical protein
MKARVLLQNILLVCLFSVVSIANAQSDDSTSPPANSMSQPATSMSQPTNNMPQTANSMPGEDLEKGLFKTVAEKNWQALEGMIAPGFQSINADKIRNRSEAIEYIRSLQFQNKTFSNFHVSNDASGKIMIVTYEMTYSETAGTHPESGKKVKNLSVWENNNGTWQWLAHAVIN